MYHLLTLGDIVMKLKTLAMLAVAAICASSLAMAGTGANKMLADDTSSQPSAPAGTPDNSGSSTDNSSSSGATDNNGSSTDNSSMPSNDDSNTSSPDTGTGDDDY